MWQDPQERYDVFMNNYTEHTWYLVTINAAIKELMQTYVKYPPRKLQSEGYSGPLTLTQYQRFQGVRDQLKGRVSASACPRATSGRAAPDSNPALLASLPLLLRLPLRSHPQWPWHGRKLIRSHHGATVRPSGPSLASSPRLPARARLVHCDKTGRKPCLPLPPSREEPPAVEISTLDALYEEAARVSLTPGWVPRKKPILWLSRSRNAMSCANWHAVLFSRTSCGVSDLLLHSAVRPTRTSAAFYLAIGTCRQIERSQTQDCGGCARCLQFDRRKATSRQVSVRCGNFRYCR